METNFKFGELKKKNLKGVTKTLAQLPIFGNFGESLIK